DPLVKEAPVEARLFVTGKDPHDDGGFWRVEAAPEHIAARIDDAHLVARRGAPLDPVHRLGVNPGVSGPHRLHVTGLQMDGGHGGNRYHGSETRVNRRPRL